MPDYHVTWEIDISADTPETAAREAWAHMRRPDSTANVFTVIEDGGEKHRVDLQEICENPFHTMNRAEADAERDYMRRHSPLPEAPPED